ncbi:hypothetical protein BU24DRAFT_488616 [Aaosphaeria arxii CBS 175.79]|uniref:Uncharacterized protein n=1 Tax=Aaosphaeria arxii CBS 175.79 TaxID=1450172 RepID=A0A6A5YCH3_9PLEO|nr:uncharacterized protein BU24DRAFT_488616 [Aaosphaeria arxii CBS 175.79]KAF2022400.1 hypothetical protein BU24DRAFT_488616 [Aaosphaeria arxii CBS 175.79]
MPAATQHQRKVLKDVSAGTDFTLDPTASFVSEVNRLALTLGWFPGDGAFHLLWMACFGTPPSSRQVRACKPNSEGSVPGAPVDNESTENESDSDETVRAGDNRSNRVPSLATEFKERAEYFGWSKRSQRYRSERIMFLVNKFEEFFDPDESNLTTWQNLCHEVGVSPVPSSITQCKKALGRVHVNLVNLLEHLRDRTVVLRTFSSNAKLTEYVRQDRSRVFPKEAAKMNVYIKALLERLFPAW